VSGRKELETWKPKRQTALRMPATTSVGGTNARRRHRNGSDPNLRYFLPKSGSSPAKPELGQEMASEGEALIEAFKNGQPFYTLTVMESCAGGEWRR
jgi:hypothetical protein